MYLRRNHSCTPTRESGFINATIDWTENSEIQNISDVSFMFKDVHAPHTCSLSKKKKKKKGKKNKAL